MVDSLQLIAIILVLSLDRLVFLLLLLSFLLSVSLLQFDVLVHQEQGMVLSKLPILIAICLGLLNCSEVSFVLAIRIVVGSDLYIFEVSVVNS